MPGIFPETGEGVKVQPEAEKIGKELPSSPATVEADPSLGAGHSVPTSATPGTTSSSRYYSRAQVGNSYLKLSGIFCLLIT